MPPGGLTITPWTVLQSIFMAPVHFVCGGLQIIRLAWRDRHKKDTEKRYEIDPPVNKANTDDDDKGNDDINSI
jgi:hypothetical protein